MHCRSEAPFIPVHRNRRVYPPAFSGCLPGAIHLFLSGLPQKADRWYGRRGIQVQCVQTDNGFEFTNRFSNSKRDLPTLFEKTAKELGIRHKLIRPYTPRHNGKVERSHREDQRRFYASHSFYSLKDFETQLAVHNRRSNNFPMRPLSWLSPLEFAVQYV